MITVWDFVRGLVPILSGALGTLICRVPKSSAGKINARPPAYMFGVIWTILYICIGISWAFLARSNKTTWLIDLLFSINIFLTFLWIILYSCKGLKKAGLYILAFVFVSTITLLNIARDSFTFYLLAPYIGWVLFALMLNFTEVNSLNPLQLM